MNYAVASLAWCLIHLFEVAGLWIIYNPLVFTKEISIILALFFLGEFLIISGGFCEVARRRYLKNGK